MKLTPRPIDCLALLFLLISARSPARASSSSQPELVRLAYVQGDVRVSRGNRKHPELSGAWEKAVAYLPIQQGFALATGKGRAEIEFEDGSVLYLAPNSVLLFRGLTVRNGAPRTDLELLSGIATMDAHPVAQGLFRLEVPQDTLNVEYPESAFLRVRSYLDGVSITPQENETANHNGRDKVHLLAGQTVTYADEISRQIVAPAAKKPDAWDEWVLASRAARQKEMVLALKASGLTAPIPGLVSLYENGKFLACPPHGTCWRPNAAALAKASAAVPPDAAAFSAEQVVPASGEQMLGSAQVQQARVLPLIHSETFFPSCGFDGVRVDTFLNPITHRKIVRMRPYAGYFPWDVAECYSGGWIAGCYVYVDGGWRFSQECGTYVYVVSQERRYGPPLLWVRLAGGRGFVPVSPHHRRNGLPVNIKHGVLIPEPRARGGPEWIAYRSSDKLKVLKGVPRLFKTSIAPALLPAARPVIEAHLAEGFLPKGDRPQGAFWTAAISYRYRSRQFVALRRIDSGRRVRVRPVAIARVNSRGVVSGGIVRGYVSDGGSATGYAVHGTSSGSRTYRGKGTVQFSGFRPTHSGGGYHSSAPPVSAPVSPTAGGEAAGDKGSAEPPRAGVTGH